MFDLLKCGDSVLQEAHLQQSLLYVVKECYLRTDLSLEVQKSIIEKLYQVLGDHIKNCRECLYVGQMC